MKKVISIGIVLLLILNTIIFHHSESKAAVAPRLISGEIYYIKNVNSGQYLTVAGTGAVASSLENVVQNRLGSVSLNRQRWKIDYFESSGAYRIMSMASPEGTILSLDVYLNNNENSSNISIFTDYAASDRRWDIVLNADNCSYRIMSRCSQSSKGVTVSNASCSTNANVFQYQYNGSKNDEWIFEPVYNYSKELGANYATQNYNRYFYTYPKFSGWGNDCANFVSQCMLAGGVHYQGQWWIYKLNNNYPNPQSSTQFDNSWDVQTMGGFLGIGASSPWVSASKFCDFWSARVTYEDYTASYILAHPGTVYSRPFYIGDVVSIISSGSATHTMYITSYGSYNGAQSFMMTYHSANTLNKSLLQIAESYPNATFRFYKIH